MRVLGIETATDVCAVGLVDGERDLADLALLRPRQHGARLAPLVDAALEAAGVRPDDLGGIAVSAGPGSYTGLRIGVSLAKGLALATGASLIAVPTLRALAEVARPQVGEGACLIPVLPSRRGEVYAAAYRVESGAFAEVSGATALSVNDIASLIPPSDRIGVCGPGADRVLPHLPDVAWHLRDRPSGLAVARLGRQRLARGESDDLASVEPAYLKPFVSGGA